MTGNNNNAMVVDAVEASSNNATATKYDYDVVVIGGGSGGLAFAKKAADYGAKVALFDYVVPTSHGTKWGLGGTCVNVGCIPKKLMHYTALLHEAFHDAKALGWDFNAPQMNWSKMLQTVNYHVFSLNFGYTSQLNENNVDYHNEFASFIDPHTIGYTHNDTDERISAKYIVLAVGGRPYIPNVPGKEFAITSDDIFWRKRAPGKTLCVGASYIALETAGFLHGMGFDVTVAVRSILLRGFDRECAELIGKSLVDIGVKFRHRQTPLKMEKLDDGKIRVTFQRKANEDEEAVAANEQKEQKEEPMVEIFDTVLYATGRRPQTKNINLEAAGVIVDDQNGKIRCNKEQTNVEHIFAVGDIVYGGLELTPVAIQAGRLLAQRLFTNKDTWMNYTRVPTTVFTPMEYSNCGYSEEESYEVFGEENVEIYHMKQMALEHSAVHRQTSKGEDITNELFFKLICDKSRNERVVGIHYIGPHAGEVMQGFALAVKLGCTKADFDDCVGIHPTCAEWFTTLTVTKASGETAEATAC